MPSHKLIDHVEEKLGTAHVHLLFGIDELIDPRGISIEVLVKLDDPSLDRTNLASLVTKGLKVPARVFACFLRSLLIRQRSRRTENCPIPTA